MHLHAYLLTSLALVASVAHPAAADPKELHVATVFADGSEPQKLLAEGADDVAKKTTQRVLLKYVPGGAQLDQGGIILRLNRGSLDGAVLTSVGLASIDASIRVLDLPNLFASVDEVDYVAGKMWPHFQKTFAAKGYQLGERAAVGWTYLLSKTEVASLDALKSQKVWLNGDDAIMRAIDKELGVAGVPLALSETYDALKAGHIEVGSATPSVALELGWGDHVKFLSTLPIDGTVTAAIYRLDSLEKLTKDDRKLLADIDREVAIHVRTQVSRDDEVARRQAEHRNIKLAHPSAAMISGYAKASAAVTKELTGKVFSKAELALAIKYRDEYRAKTKK